LSPRTAEKTKDAAEVGEYDQHEKPMAVSEPLQEPERTPLRGVDGSQKQSQPESKERGGDQLGRRRSFKRLCCLSCR